MTSVVQLPQYCLDWGWFLVVLKTFKPFSASFSFSVGLLFKLNLWTKIKSSSHTFKRLFENLREISLNIVATIIQKFHSARTTCHLAHALSEVFSFSSRLLVTMQDPFVSEGDTGGKLKFCVSIATKDFNTHSTPVMSGCQSLTLPHGTSTVLFSQMASSFLLFMFWRDELVLFCSSVNSLD